MMSPVIRQWMSFPVNSLMVELWVMWPQQDTTMSSLSKFKILVHVLKYYVLVFHHYLNLKYWYMHLNTVYLYVLPLDRENNKTDKTCLSSLRHTGRYLGRVYPTFQPSI